MRCVAAGAQCGTGCQPWHWYDVVWCIPLHSQHMLFLGTEKYPDENSYSAYLNKHGGWSNAYTASEDTNYFFELQHDYLEEALDRFAQFFIAPLFTESCVAREMNVRVGVSVLAPSPSVPDATLCAGGELREHQEPPE